MDPCAIAGHRSEKNSRTADLDVRPGDRCRRHGARCPDLENNPRPRYRHEILNDPNADLPAAVRTVTDTAYDKLFKRYSSEQLARAKVGYETARAAFSRKVRTRHAEWRPC
jgi:hypothetical protein